MMLHSKTAGVNRANLNVGYLALCDCPGGDHLPIEGKDRFHPCSQERFTTDVRLTRPERKELFALDLRRSEARARAIDRRKRPPVIAALQGPYQFFLSPAVREVGYGWSTNRRPSESIRLHHDMVLHVLDDVDGQFGIPPERRLLVGFSQAMALNYRFASTYLDAIRA